MQGEFRGDVSRDTFDPTKHFSRVFMQQGRVQLDADWNEQSDILLHYFRSLAVGLIGPHGGNATQPGFALITTEADVENLKDINGDDLSPERISALKESLRASGFLVGIGDYFVGGLLCVNDNYLGFTEQEGYPFSTSLPLDRVRNTAGPYMVFLDVWERHVSCQEDAEICEVALGGPDTASRGKIVCTAAVLPPALTDQTRLYDQVKLGDQVKALKDAANPDDTAKAKKALNESAEETRKKLAALSRATLRARARISGMPEGDCNIPPEAQYRGPENQLYRVEIQRGGSGWDGITEKERPAGNAETAATFKWSRDNASVVFPILSLQGDSARLAHFGRDVTSGLKMGDWVEIVDDSMTLQGEAGPLRQIKALNPDELTVTLSAPVDQDYDETSTVHPMLRRWDQRRADGTPAENALLVKEGTGEEDINWISLEDGVQIQFPRDPNNRYRAGDYWLIPARVATGDVLWPKVPDGNRQPVAKALPPHGVEHHHAPLAIISVDGQKITVEHDCRRVFLPLAVT